MRDVAFVEEPAQPSVVSNRLRRRGVIGLAAAAVLLFLIDAAIFRTGLYSGIVDVNSAAGSYGQTIRSERARHRDARKQFLIVGDSRSRAIRPRIAEESRSQRDIAFANVSVSGSSARSWYYLLRDLDPHADRYNIVLFGLDDFDDNGGIGIFESSGEVRMPVYSLGLRDLFDFPFTFRDPLHRRDAFLECLFKGSAYKQDFQQLLAHPWDRMERAAQSRRVQTSWLWGYVGEEWSLAGLEVDWAKRTVKFPEGTTDQTRDALQGLVQHPNPPVDPWKVAFRRQWLTRIAEHYRGSRTLLVFLRIPWTPFPIPTNFRSTPLHGVLRDLAAAQPNILLLDEHLTDGLEQPRYFYDYTHLSADGARAMTHIVVDQIPTILARAEGHT